MAVKRSISTHVTPWCAGVRIEVSGRGRSAYLDDLAVDQLIASPTLA